MAPCTDPSVQFSPRRRFVKFASAESLTIYWARSRRDMWSFEREAAVSARNSRLISTVALTAST
jgi:hypothetical protein